MENIDGLMVLSNAPSALNSEIYDPSGFFSSLISSGSSNLGNIKSEHGNGHKELIEKASASTNLTQSSSFTPEMQHERITSMISSTSHLRNQLQTAGLEAQFMLSDQPNSQIQQMFLQSASSVNNPAARTPCISTWSSEGSTLTSLERQLSSEMRAQVSQNAVPGKPNTVALWGTWLGKSVNNQYAAPFIHATEGELLEQSTSILTLPEEFKHPASSMQSSVINMFSSDGKERSLNVPSTENDLFDGLGLDFGFELAGESWEDFIMPLFNDGQSTLSTGVSECISELDVGSMAVPRKGLFSELGLDQLLDDIVGNSSSVTKSNSEDQFSSTKRRRLGSSSVNSNQVQSAEVIPKSQVGLWIDDSYSINAGGSVAAQPKRPVEPAKATKKRAKPGESTRPRPKDRQQIKDRLED
ncbi:Transcription factor bHLH157 [Vitis vinifera]|uniref:Transcription factor bHLH157 n=1 Tax=Vitis vinifera TaxID=29760 RepID=A0A438BV00_VITVI|nr:Transcription factor bHLH157 [Vitis vinifera]